MMADFARTADFIEAHPDWPRLEDMLRTAERALPLEATPEFTDAERLRWFQAHPPVSAAGAMAFATSLFATGQTAKARELLVRTWRQAKFSRDDERAFLRHFAAHVTIDDHIARLDRLLYDRQRSAAKRQAQRLNRDDFSLHVCPDLLASDPVLDVRPDPILDVGRDVRLTVDERDVDPGTI